MSNEDYKYPPLSYTQARMLERAMGGGDWTMLLPVTVWSSHTGKCYGYTVEMVADSMRRVTACYSFWISDNHSVRIKWMVEGRTGFSTVYGAGVRDNPALYEIYLIERVLHESDWHFYDDRYRAGGSTTGDENGAYLTAPEVLALIKKWCARLHGGER